MKTEIVYEVPNYLSKERKTVQFRLSQLPTAGMGSSDLPYIPTKINKTWKNSVRKHHSEHIHITTKSLKLGCKQFCGLDNHFSHFLLDVCLTYQSCLFRVYTGHQQWLFRWYFPKPPFHAEVSLELHKWSQAGWLLGFSFYSFCTPLKFCKIWSLNTTIITCFMIFVCIFLLVFIFTTYALRWSQCSFPFTVP